MNFSRVVAKGLNQAITGKNFVDKDLNKYLYASLSQPPIEIIDKNESNNELDFTVKCPNCGRPANYGEEIFMLNGHIYCAGKNCRDELIEKNPYLKEKYNL